jgi:hypothetical protein
MSDRTASTTVTFKRPFALSGLGTLPAGTYELETIEERLPTVMTEGFRRVSTLLRLPSRTDGTTIVAEVAAIDFDEFAQARERDAASCPRDVAHLLEPGART